jgi:hypothetical protein
LINGKHGQGTHSTKIGADKLTEIPQMPQNLSVQIVCPSPKVWDFKEKRLHLASVVRGQGSANKTFRNFLIGHFVFVLFP